MSLTYEGRGISAGIGIGLASVLPDVRIDYPEEKVDPEEADEEFEDFKQALDRAKTTTGRIKDQAQENFQDSLSNLFSVQEMILEDPLFIEGVRQRIQSELLCAESAVIETLQGIRAEFASKTEDTPINTRKIDIMDAGWRVLRHLDTSMFSPRLPQDGVIVAVDLMPSMAVRLEDTSIEGVIIQNVDRSSHIAVITQALEIPTVGIMDNQFYREVDPGTRLIVGANQNRVIVDPDKDTIKAHEEARNQYFEFTRELQDKTQDLGPDDLSITVRSNLGFLSEVSMVKRHGGFGSGLVRTEFLFMAHSAEYPDYETQRNVYGQLSESLQPHPVTLRTFDLGGDKTGFESDVAFLSDDNGQGRGISRSLQDEDELRTQLRAMLDTHKEYGNVRLLLPMVGSPDEVKQVRSLINELTEDIGVEVPELGVIVEIPSLVFMLEDLAGLVDFLSIGTNDLMYYLIGADRFAWQDRDFVDLPDPALLRCINKIAQQSEELGLSVSVCGEIAGNPLFTPVFMGMDVAELSMSPIRIPEVKLVASLCNDQDAQQFANRAIQLTGRNELVNWVHEDLTPYIENLFNNSNLLHQDQDIHAITGGMM
ncbi:MAG: phosphoenolpyruvate--protein phosphotransferase [bacterium]